MTADQRLEIWDHVRILVEMSFMVVLSPLVLLLTLPSWLAERRAFRAYQKAHPALFFIPPKRRSDGRP